MKIIKMLKFTCFLLFSLPKTIYFNFRCLSANEAIKLPILIGYNIKLKKCNRGVISFVNKEKVRPFLVRVGFGGSEAIVSNRHGIVNIEKGSLVFHGQATFAEGSTLDCSGHMEIGDHFSTNRNAFVSCSKEVIIGKDVMLGWDVTIFDAIGHTVYYQGEPKTSQVPIHIGDHVWLCSKSQILKGSEIDDGSIVAWGAIVTKPIKGNNILVGGVPAKKIQDSISWGPYIGV